MCDIKSGFFLVFLPREDFSLCDIKRGCFLACYQEWLPGMNVSAHAQRGYSIAPRGDVGI